jgi:uncharacterized protein (DUF2062 family)
MLFARRTRPNFSERVRAAVWPSAGWRRSARYYGKRIVRLSASPHAVAAGVAAGVVVSWTPFIGFHFLLSAAIAFLLGGNLIASAIGAAVIGNPLTFPFMWWSSYAVGRVLLGMPPEHERLAEMMKNIGRAPLAEIMPILKPMVVGALPLGALSGIVTYLIVSFMVRQYRKARRARLAERRAGSSPVSEDGKVQSA